MASEPVTIYRVGGKRTGHAVHCQRRGLTWHVQSFDGDHVRLALEVNYDTMAEITVPIEIIELAARLLHLDQPLAATALIQKAGAQPRDPV